jgi:hypothetical protein
MAARKYVSGGPSAASVAEAAEIDDARDALALGHPREVLRSRLLALLKAGAAGHRVDEEVGDVDLLAGAVQARFVGDVATADLATEALQRCRARGVAHEAAHGGSGGDQRLCEATADEAGRSG